MTDGLKPGFNTLVCPLNIGDPITAFDVDLSLGTIYLTPCAFHSVLCFILLGHFYAERMFFWFKCVEYSLIATAVLLCS